MMGLVFVALHINLSGHSEPGEREKQFILTCLHRAAQPSGVVAGMNMPYLLVHTYNLLKCVPSSLQSAF